MQRRDFIRKAGLASAGAIAMPYILPSGRLFAATGNRKVDHVVFCLFAGGVRSLESVQFAEGNLMRALFTGTAPVSNDIAAYLDPLPTLPLSNPLQQSGTLFRQFKYKEGPTGHYNGHTTAITGTYTETDLSIKDHPKTPTIFEYYRKHNSPSLAAKKCWWVSNSLGPYPALNYSSYPGYGALYGANFIAPTWLFASDARSVMGNLRNFNSAEQNHINRMQNFMDNNFNRNFINQDAGIYNDPTDMSDINLFINQMLVESGNGTIWNAMNAGNSMNNDMVNVVFAEKIIQRYLPELLVVNMTGVDVCHTNFTEYCNNLTKADFAVAHLWKTIQNTPGMANNTVMIVAPEHGRNLNGNSNVDQNGRNALDHTASTNGNGDQTARDIFCMVVGPPNVVAQNQVINTVAGDSIEIVPTIASLLGFEQAIPPGLLKPYNTCDMQAAFI
jgi:hypothetical protein